MKTLDHLLNNTRAWAEKIKANDPEFFEALSKQQNPQYLWIGCSDSRVPANQIIDVTPGDMFVHRNVANVVVHTDLNCLSVVQYAVEVLRVKHLIVCGHYGCGGVKAAMGHEHHGLIDNWLRTVKDTQQYFWHELNGLDDAARFDRLVELNVIEQVYNLGKTHTIQAAWAQRRRPYIHGWVFDLRTGLIRPQTGMINDNDKIGEVCKFTNGVVGGPLLRAAA